MVTVAVDAMGGDRAPHEIVAGARVAAGELGARILLVGRDDEVRPLVDPHEERIEVVPASEVVAMDDAPSSVRTRTDSSISVAAQLVRDGKADAMVSAGNTGAAMTAALLAWGRMAGVARPAIGVPIPRPGRTPQLLVDGGATVDCEPEWLVQFARMGREYVRVRHGIDAPAVGLLSNGEEAGKGDALRKAASPLLTASVPGFVGNIEGRDFMLDTVDVIVTDGFTGNVALKTLEGGMRGTARLVFDTLMSTPELQQASESVLPALLDAADLVGPDREGGAILLGVRGVCMISHGSSNARAVRNAIARAVEAVERDVVTRVGGAVSGAR